MYVTKRVLDISLPPHGLQVKLKIKYIHLYLVVLLLILFLNIWKNCNYYEFGTFAGIFHQLVHVRCEGTEDGYIFSSNRRELYGSLFWGLYASTFYKNIFFNYSLSGYNSYFEVKKLSVDVSTILSNYFTLGYYLNKRISITVGAVGTKGRFDMHWAASFGVNFHPL